MVICQGHFIFLVDSKNKLRNTSLSLDMKMLVENLNHVLALNGAPLNILSNI